MEVCGGILDSSDSALMLTLCALQMLVLLLLLLLLYLKGVSHVRHPVDGNRADEGVLERAPGDRMLQVVIGACVYRVRHGSETGGHPHDDHHAHRPRQTGGGMRAQRVTDGQIALDSERSDGQDRRRRRHFRQERLEQTVRLAEAPRVRLEDRIQLWWQSCTHTHTHTHTHDL